MLGEGERVFQLGNWVKGHTINQDCDSRKRNKFTRANHELSIDVLRLRCIRSAGHSGQHIYKLLESSAYKIAERVNAFGVDKTMQNEKHV